MAVRAKLTEVDEILRDFGLRRTPVRSAVVRVLSDTHTPLSALEIRTRLKDVDAVTVYRTLNTFTRKGLAHRVRGDDRSWLYALEAPSEQNSVHRHPHFVCGECGQVQCLEEAVIPSDLARKLGVDEVYDVAYAEVVVHGRCPKCRVSE